jgi:ubiquinone/menaquinone biosynthesis C-methylase UbiE
MKEGFQDSMSQTFIFSEPANAEPTAPPAHALYSHQRLAQAYPGLDRLAFDSFSAVCEAHGDETSRIDTLLRRLDNLVDLNQLRNVVVIGCGPKPQSIKLLQEKNHVVVGIEPVPSFVGSAREYLGSAGSVVEGAAEAIPLPDGSQQIVFCYSVLEHVVSPSKSLDEMFRVLSPGGIAIIQTTNKLRISPTGWNGEYRVPFFNWLPDLVKECFIFQHLHYDPRLANYSQLPAVHWFSYASLCALGRQAGFARFYSLLDLVDENDSAVRNSKFKKWLLKKVKFNPWLRALTLTQRGDTIIMLKK